MALLSSTYRGSPVWAIAMSILPALAIAYLALVSASRVYRAALFPIALYGLWVVTETYITSIPDEAPFYEACITCTLSIALRYAFTTETPVIHPLPRRPPLDKLRNNIVFKTLNLVTSDLRHINIAPNPPLQASRRAGQSGRGYFSSVTYHLSHMIFYIFLMDLFVYPLYTLDPTGFGSPYPIPEDRAQGRGDIVAFCVREAGSWWWALWIWLAFEIAAATMVAMMGTYHMLALIGVGSGIWLDEEWPQFMDAPWKSDSLNDLWGKRYHQMLRDLFLLWAKPFESLPRPIHLLAVFTASALFHILIYRSMTGEYILAPYLIFYLAQGIGCIGERAFYKTTGRRVKGWWGRAWLYSWILLTGWGMVNEYYRIGWVGMMRGKLVEGGTSPAEWLARWAGIAPDVQKT